MGDGRWVVGWWGGLWRGHTPALRGRGVLAPPALPLGLVLVGNSGMVLCRGVAGNAAGGAGCRGVVCWGLRRRQGLGGLLLAVVVRSSLRRGAGAGAAPGAAAAVGVGVGG